jgi:hypothetical protein
MTGKQLRVRIANIMEIDEELLCSNEAQQHIDSVVLEYFQNRDNGSPQKDPASRKTSDGRRSSKKSSSSNVLLFAATLIDKIFLLN